MSWLLRHNWLWSLFAFVLGAAITWLLLDRRRPAAPPPQEHVEEEPVLVGAAATQAGPVRQAPLATRPAPVSRAAPTSRAAPATQAAPVAKAGPVVETAKPVEETTAPAEPAEPVFSRVMDSEPTLFDVDTVTAPIAPGRYGEGSADAVPHQGPPDGFTIKGNAQSMLFHTPDSPYYGRTKPEVWFRTEADAERAGFAKYTRRPRKSADPRD